VKHLIFALLAALPITLSLSVTAASVNLNSSRSNAAEERGKPTKEQVCDFTIDQKGIRRAATEQQKQKCQKEAGDTTAKAPAGKSTTQQ
jgi:hypothetical protein